MNQIFVYGTLRKGGALYKQFSGLKFIRNGYIKGYELRTASSYPAYPIITKVDDIASIVVGDVVSLTSGELQYINMMEANCGYSIIHENIYNPSSKEIEEMQVYRMEQFNPSTWDQVITDGDWIKFVRSFQR